MTDLQRRIAGLSPEKRALLVQRLMKAPAAPQRTIPRRSEDGPCPLPVPQQRLWFLSQLHADGRAYNEPFAVRMRGPLDLGVLRRAVTEIAARHESLRMAFTLVDGRPMQIVAPAVDVPLPVIDVPGATLAAREAEARRIASAELALPFDLAAAPLMRAYLLRLGETDHVFLTITHHIVTDGISASIFLKELSAVYAAFAAGRPSPLPEVQVQYRDFAAWQEARMTPEALEKHLAYWQTRLDSLTPLELPTDRPRPPVQTFRGGHLHSPLNAGAIPVLDELARRCGATRFMALIAACAVLLHRYTGSDDVAIGTPVAGRDKPELAGTIGLFSKPVILRADFSGDPAFAEFLGRVREAALGAYAHQDLPFEKLLERMPAQRNLSYPPLFQVMFGMHDAAWGALPLPGLEVEPFDFEIGTAKFDLTVVFSDEGAGPEASFEYNADLFEPATIERMAGHFRRLIEGIAENPARRVSALPLLTDAERHTMLVEWNSTAAVYPRDKCVHEIFEDWAARTPDAPAVVLGDRSLAYGDLDSRANRLANHLRGLGVGRETLVALLVDRSIEMVVGMLAVLKAGGAYVPLDPDYPAERTAFMLEDTAAPVILTQSRLVEKVPPTPARVVRLDADWPLIERESAEPLDSVASADSPMYVIYTSGSTGRPKGTVACHRGVTRLVFDARYMPVRPADAVGQAASICFDGSVYELWAPLLSGARMVIITKDVLLSPADFANEVRARGVNVVDLSTAVLNHLVAEAPSVFSGFRYVAAGGEAADPAVCRKLLAIEPPPEHVINDYGPTECTDVATWYEVKEVPAGARSIPIGRPIANTSCYLLDAHMQPVPIGVPGELYIGGDGLATGYLNRPQLTRETFVPNPFDDNPASRLYKTGDLVRYRADGNLEFLGRVDAQVKIRGFRVEPGEVEALLGAHESVRETAVLCREDRPGDKRLVAYVSLNGGPRSSPADLRLYLESRLPAYMVPSAFVIMDALPLTPNGKVDRAALPAPDDAPAADSVCAAPRTPVEEALVKIWAEVLGREQVGIRDNFFDLGGHSLLAVRLFSRIEKVFGRRLPLVTLFEGPTVERLAALMSKEGRSDVLPTMVTIEKGIGGAPLFCVATADALLYADLARHLGPRQPLYGLHPQGVISPARPDIDIRKLAARYVAEIRTVQPKGPYHLGGLCAGGVVAFEMAQILVEQGDEVRLLALFDTPGPMSALTKYGYMLSRANRVADHVYHHMRTLWRLDSGQRMPYVRARLDRLARRLLRRPLPPAAPDGEMPVERAYWMAFNGAYDRAMVRYDPRPYSGEIRMFHAGEASAWRFDRGRAKWSKYARRGAYVHVVPGTHDRMLHEPFVADVARQLRECMAAPAGTA